MPEQFLEYFHRNNEHSMPAQFLRSKKSGQRNPRGLEARGAAGWWCYFIFYTLGVAKRPGGRYVHQHQADTACAAKAGSLLRPHGKDQAAHHLHARGSCTGKLPLYASVSHMKSCGRSGSMPATRLSWASWNCSTCRLAKDCPERPHMATVFSSRVNLTSTGGRPW